MPRNQGNMSEHFFFHYNHHNSVMIFFYKKNFFGRGQFFLSFFTQTDPHDNVVYNATLIDRAALPHSVPSDTKFHAKGCAHSKPCTYTCRNRPLLCRRRYQMRGHHQPQGEHKQPEEASKKKTSGRRSFLLKLSRDPNMSLSRFES